MLDVTDEQLLELSQKSFVRLDGAWFMAAARTLGIQAAWDLDVEAWKQFSYVMGKNLRKTLIPEPVWPESLLDAMDVFMRVLDIRGRDIAVENDSIVVRVTDCAMQKAIAKAGIADCGIATVATYRGVIRGLFGKETEPVVEHTKNLNRGDECCEVVIRMPGK
ncbi:MAG: hypothetical protein JW838_10175 [Spirochaetes bacterium]|nr:hypothetical protein [Spirochaetota bacterium]